MHRKKTVCILVLLGLTYSVCGLSHLQAAEGANATLQWDSPTSLDLASLIIYCFLTSPPQRMVFEMAAGVELTGSGRGTFSGRVHCDREALRLGQVRIHLTRLTPQDSGLYWCYMYGNYDREKRDWTQKSSEFFVLKVGTDSEVSTTGTKEPTTHGKDGNTPLNISDLARNIVLYFIHGSVVLCAMIVLPIFVMDSGD